MQPTVRLGRMICCVAAIAHWCSGSAVLPARADGAVHKEAPPDKQTPSDKPAAPNKPARPAANESPGEQGPAGANGQVSAEAHWCDPMLTEITQRACLYVPELAVDAKGTRTLVIFLHSLISAAPGAAWDLQKRMAQMARSYHFSMLVPQGRRGLGPRRSLQVLAWPTSMQTQSEVESALLDEWRSAVRLAEQRVGAFDRVLMFGFSNGAYYATSLAFREVFPVDGVAVFAGGSGKKYQRISAARAKLHVPLFVAYGKQDPDNPQQKQLVRLLEQLHWPHRSLAARAGHTVTDQQVRAALKYLGHDYVTQ